MLYRRAEDLDRSPSRRASLCARERPAVEHQARIGGAHLIKLEEASDSSAKASATVKRERHVKRSTARLNQIRYKPWLITQILHVSG